MVKKLIFILFLVLPPLLIAQEIERVWVEGKIHVPKGEDTEGISLYNVSSQKGTVTDVEGNFEIELAENDRLQVFALQYQSFTIIIDRGTIDRKTINIFVNPAITQLDEVIVRPYDLSGNVHADVAKIPTYYITKDWDLSYRNLEFGYYFTPDEASSIRGNVAEEALNSHNLKHGLDFIAILGGVGNLLFPSDRKINSAERRKVDESLSNNMQQRFSREFIHDNFGISKEKAFDFLFYVQENGLDTTLLKPENEMQLMDFLHKSSEEYKKRGK